MAATDARRLANPLSTPANHCPLPNARRKLICHCLASARLYEAVPFEIDAPWDQRQNEPCALYPQGGELVDLEVRDDLPDDK